MGSSGGVESMAPFMSRGEERILSIMLSSSELAKLDLSNIQFFLGNVDCLQNGLNDHDKEVDPLFITRQDSFSFPLETEGGASTAPVQVFKSKGAMEAEKFMLEQNRANNSRGKKKSASVEEEKKISKAQDESALHDKLRSPPLPTKTSRAEEDRAEAEEIMRINPSIDLKSSHASKFLMQLMPWEFHPSPLSSFTPAAVPFKWEEIPGKPKTLHDAHGLPPQTNSLPVLHPPPRLLMPPPAAKKLHAPQSQSNAQHSRSSSGSCGAEEKRVIFVEMKRLEENPRSFISSLDYKLPSPWNGDVKPAYSPFRDLGPPDDAVHRLRKKATSIVISFWRKFNTKTYMPKPNSVPPVLSCGSREVLIDREALWVEVNESTRTNHSLDARIAVGTGGVDDEGFSDKTMMCLWETKDLRPIPDHEYCKNGLKLVERRPRRKWVMRKLRRPARFFSALFKTAWRAVSLRKSRHRNRGNIKLPYKSLVR
jgi:hypothetical protein